MKPLSFEDVHGKVCVITGGGGIIGSALAQGLAAAGVKLALLDLKQELADQAAHSIAESTSTAVIGVAGNVLERESLMQAKARIHQELGTIDLLINCAGGNSPKGTTQVEWIEPEMRAELESSFFGLPLEGFEHVLHLNFLGTVLPTMVFAADMVDRKQGVILNISSMSAFRPLTKVGAYSAAKAAINNFTEWLAVHFAKMNIRVNAIAPGFLLTTQNRFLLTDEQTGELTPRGRKVIANTPMGRFGEPEELCGTVLYLLSNVSAFVTGVVIPIDGGFNAYSGV